jgi:hypothetical protein
MRHLLYAPIVAAVVAIILVTGARAERREATVEARGAAVDVANAHAPEPAAERPALVAQVIAPFGATIRAVPSSDGTIVVGSRCGDTWPVLGVDRGWVKVRTAAGAGWLGGSRVLVTSAPANVDCSAARFIAPSDSATVFVTAGCASLRNRPAADAPVLDCVGPGHTYTVLDGPFDAGQGDDWFRVSSPETGSGWMLAKYLHPA